MNANQILGLALVLFVPGMVLFIWAGFRWEWVADAAAIFGIVLAAFAFLVLIPTIGLGLIFDWEWVR